MKNKAFTLIELLVVIVIIGILATIATTTFEKSLEKAQRTKIVARIVSEKQSFLSECIYQGKGVEDCSVSYFHTRTNPGGTRYIDSPEECEMLCEAHNPSGRLATIEEGLWLVQGTVERCTWMWFYTDNSAQKVIRAYPMYENQTVPNCGELNTGDVARLITTGGTAYSLEESLSISPTYDYDNAPVTSDCACISALE